MFNSVCGEQQPHPARYEAGTEKTRAPNIQFFFKRKKKSLGYVNINRKFHLIIVQTLMECSFQMFSDHSEASCNI